MKRQGEVDRLVGLDKLGMMIEERKVKWIMKG